MVGEAASDGSAQSVRRTVVVRIRFITFPVCPPLWDFSKQLTPDASATTRGGPGAPWRAREASGDPGARKCAPGRERRGWAHIPCAGAAGSSPMIARAVRLLTGRGGVQEENEKMSTRLEPRLP